MQKLSQHELAAKMEKIFSSKAGSLIVFLIVCGMSYGIFIPFLGYYWDDWGFLWMSEFYGSEGLSQYFSTNRPFWSAIFQIPLNIIGIKPLYWHIFAFVMRYLNGIAFWWLLKLIWPKREFFSFVATLLFLVFPGFSQQAIAITYSNFFIIQLLLILSFGTMVLAVENRRHSYIWWTISYLLAIIHQFTMEYFFALEILRLIILWIKFNHISNWKAKSKKVLITYLPYLMISLAYVYWRIFILSFQTYQPSLVGDVISSPIAGISDLVVTILSDAFFTGLLSWLAPISIIIKSEGGMITKLILWLGMAVVGCIVFISLSVKKHHYINRKWIVEPLIFAFVGLFTAGAPFWLTNLEIGFNTINDRFAFPMMMVSSVFLASILFLVLQNKPRGLFFSAAIFIMIGTGFQINSMSIFKQEWEKQQTFFKQLEWRIPQLESGTLIISPEIRSPHMSDLSFTGPINWLFGANPNSETTGYLLAYIPLRFGGIIPELSPGLPAKKDLLVNHFEGSTSQVITIMYEPPGCVRIFDAKRDTSYPSIPKELRTAISLSEPAAWISNIPDNASIPNEIITTSVSSKSWCYYFEKADLAAQYEDWEEVVRLGEIAFSSGDTPNDPTERIPFIQGYAFTGNWERAEELSLEVFQIADNTAPMICELWQSMIGDSSESAGDVNYITIVDTLNCESEGST